MLGVLAANGETSPVTAFVASSIATLETVADSETDTDLALAASALTLPSRSICCGVGYVTLPIGPVHSAKALA